MSQAAASFDLLRDRGCARAARAAARVEHSYVRTYVRTYRRLLGSKDPSSLPIPWLYSYMSI